MATAATGPPDHQTTSSAGPHEEARELTGLLFAVTHASQSQFEDAAAELGLAGAQARALLGLDRPAPMRSLAANLGCDASNITGIADRLEKRGLVERRPDTRDRRVKLLVLTPTGARVRNELADRVAQMSPVITHLTAAERATLREILTRITGPDITDLCSGGGASAATGESAP